MDLSEKFIITTRPIEKAIPAYSVLCLDVVNIPLTSLVPIPIDTGFVMGFNPEVCIFTSEYGANLYANLFGPAFKESIAVAIGQATASAISGLFRNVMVPEEMTSTGVTDILESKHLLHRRIALFTSEKSNMVIERFLMDRSARYCRMDLYRPVPIDHTIIVDYIAREGFAGVLVTSSYELDLLKETLKDRISSIPVFVIGKTTLERAEELKLSVREPIGKSNIKELLRSIAAQECK
ncbi:MAG: uroporphyrinogen-III synthase [Thermoplasmataceae archaeon]